MQNRVPVEQLERIVGSDNLMAERELVSVYPVNAEAVSAVVKLAAMEKFRILPLGSGSVLNLTKVSLDDTLILRSDRLNRVVKVVPEDLYVILQAGFPLGSLNPRLESHNLFYPLADGGYSGTIGGSVAVNMAGKSRERSIQTREYVLALQVVDAQGQILNVGARTFKSVTGYDLARLFTGSWGTLGFITEITLRLIPARKRKDYPNMTVEPPLLGKDPGTKDPKIILSSKIKESLDSANVFPKFESLL